MKTLQVVSGFPLGRIKVEISEISLCKRPRGPAGYACKLTEKALLGREKKKIYVPTEDNANYILLDFFEIIFYIIRQDFLFAWRKIFLMVREKIFDSPMSAMKKFLFLF